MGDGFVELPCLVAVESSFGRCMMTCCLLCGDEIQPKKRAELGYRVCLFCGDDVAKQERASWTVAPMNKSNYVLVTDPEMLKQLNPKRQGY